MIITTKLTAIIAPERKSFRLKTLLSFIILVVYSLFGFCDAKSCCAAEYNCAYNKDHTKVNGISGCGGILILRIVNNDCEGGEAVYREGKLVSVNLCTFNNFPLAVLIVKESNEVLKGVSVENKGNLTGDLAVNCTNVKEVSNLKVSNLCSGLVSYILNG